MARMERKYLAHFIDANFGEGSANYVRLGKDLETYQEELNPQVEIRRNILGEQNVIHQGYQVQSAAEPYYADQTDPLFEPIAAIANERKTGAGCQTTRVEVLVDAAGNPIWAWKEDCWVVPNAVGGDTSGVQLPFNVYDSGNRTPGVFNMQSKSFTAATISLSSTTLTVNGSTAGTLTATVSPAVTSGEVLWNSSNTTIGTVAGSSTNKATGTVTGVANGTTVVTAEWFGAIASCTVTVSGQS